MQSSQQKVDATLTLRVPSDVAERVREAAELEDRSISNWLRIRVVDLVKSPPAGQRASLSPTPPNAKGDARQDFPNCITHKHAHG